MAAAHSPKLWFTPATVETLRKRLAAGEPTVAGIFALARKMADTPLAEALGPIDPKTRRHTLPFGHQYPEACSIAYLLTGDATYAVKAADAFLAETEPFHVANLGLGAWAMYGAIVHECCYAALAPATHIALTRRLIKLIGGLMEIRHGDPHTPTNNHWAVVHGGAAMAAMAAHHHPIDERGTLADLTDEIAWARQRVKAFVTIHGDQGLYHEGIGYMGYPASFWWPALAAFIGFDGWNLVEEYPALKNQAAAAFSVACARPGISDETGKPSGKWGMKLSWNDDGLGWMASAAVPMMIHFAHAHQKPALRWMYDQLNGIAVGEGVRQLGSKAVRDEGRNEGAPSDAPAPLTASLPHCLTASPKPEFCPGFAGWFFTLLFYPYDTPAVEGGADGQLPWHITDYRQGLSIFRSRYQDRDDAIFGAYAKCQIPGGHEQEDAGSIRFMALGHDWIMGGGQAKGQRAWQSVVFPAGHGHPHSLGAILWDQPLPDGGVFGIDLRKVSHGYHERFVALDYSGKSGSPAVIALLDQVDDHLRDRDWLWNMTFEPGLSFTPHADKAGFTLASEDGANLVARFLGAVPDRLTLEKTPDSHRVFQNSTDKKIYPGRPFVSAGFKNRPHLGIYAVMAVQRGPAPEIRLIEHVDVQVGTHAWRRPFGSAVPASFTCGVSGSLCRHPSGDPAFQADKLVAQHSVREFRLMVFDRQTR